MKKGFTLVELLAVVIILGILAVVIIPKIQQTLRDSEKNTYEASAHALVREAEIFYTNKKINQEQFDGCIYNFGTNNNTCEGFEFKGQNPESGGIVITKDGKIAIGLKIDNYCYSKGYGEDEITIEDANGCTIPKQIGELYSFNNIGSYYVIDSNAHETKLLSVYNLNSDGVVSPSVQGTSTLIWWTTVTITDPCPPDDAANDPSYLKEEYGNSYPAYVYNNSYFQTSFIQPFSSSKPSTVKEMRLPTYNEMVILGCDKNGCEKSKYNWAYEPYYWSGTAFNNETIYSSIGALGTHERYGLPRECNYEMEMPINSEDLHHIGVRPLIVVDTKDL